MKIGELVETLKTEFPALSLSKVRYLESAGLISPHRVGNGYRRYSVADLERLRYALTAQRDEYLPLSVIRERLEEMDAAADALPAAPVARVVAAHGHILADGPMDLDSLLAHSGATEAEVKELVAIGLISPDVRGRFDARALRTVVLARQASALGLPLRNLRTVRSAAEREADAIEQAVMPRRRAAAGAAEDAASQLASVLTDLHEVLLHRAVESLS